MPPWMDKYIHYKVWDEIRFRFPNFKGVAIEAWEWKVISTRNLLCMWLHIHARIKVNPCNKKKPVVRFTIIVTQRYPAHLSWCDSPCPHSVGHIVLDGIFTYFAQMVINICGFGVGDGFFCKSMLKHEYISRPSCGPCGCKSILAIFG